MGCVPRVHSKVVLDGFRKNIETLPLDFMKITSIGNVLNFLHYQLYYVHDMLRACMRPLWGQVHHVTFTGYPWVVIVTYCFLFQQQISSTGFGKPIFMLNLKFKYLGGKVHQFREPNPQKKRVKTIKLYKI